jgi:hypothetical protein
MLLVFGAIVFNFERLRNLLAGGSWPPFDDLFADWEYYLGFVALVSVLGLISWFSCRNYNKCSGLERTDDE